MMGLFQDLLALQREIYMTFADRIRVFAQTGDWWLLSTFLPIGILFGVAHALTPGHSKALLATYLAGADASMRRGLTTAFTLSVTHIFSAVLIAVLSLPLVSVALGSVGRAPLLEDVSRGLIGLVGLWMVWRALSGSHSHHHGEGKAVGFMAGLIPCPLTLFVMTFAIFRGVPAAGLVFAATMLIGVTFVLGTVALLTTFFRARLGQLLRERPLLLERLARCLEFLTGMLLAAVAVLQITR